jgi:hypothetical protein
MRIVFLNNNQIDALRRCDIRPENITPLTLEEHLTEFELGFIYYATSALLYDGLLSRYHLNDPLFLLPITPDLASEDSRFYPKYKADYSYINDNFEKLTLHCRICDDNSFIIWIESDAVDGQYETNLNSIINELSKYMSYDHLATSKIFKNAFLNN